MHLERRNPVWIVKVACLAVVILGLSISSSYPLSPAVLAAKKKAAATEIAANMQIPENLSPAEVDSYLASLDDKQVRQVLARKLKDEAARNAMGQSQGNGERERGKLWTFFDTLEDKASIIEKQLYSSIFNIASGSEEWGASLNRLSGGKGGGHFLLTLFWGGVLILIGVVVERFLLKFSETLRQQLMTTVSSSVLQKIGRFFSRLLLDAVGVCAYIAITFVMFVLIFDKGEPGYGIIASLLLVSYYLRLIMLAAKVILSPASTALRVLPLQDRDATFMYQWILRISFVSAFFGWVSVVFLEIGQSRNIASFTHSLAGISVTVLLIAMIWQSRQRVAEAIYPGEEATAGSIQPMRSRFAQNWHYFALLYVIGIGLFWIIQVLLGGEGRIIKMIASLFLVPIFIGLDQWGQRLMKMASGELHQVVDFTEETAEKPAEEQALEGALEDKKTIKYYIPLIRRAFRTMLILALCFTILRLWGIDLSVGRVFTTRALDIIITLILGFVLWEILKTRIDQKLKEEAPGQDEDTEEGGAGGSRNVTLLLLLKKFVLSVMLVIISLIVLSALGIDIGPLIAGAGVIGLAIGFGAQTLVKDIISGIFFLIDDAFRVGDYIEAGGTKGMVEHISLRSMRLRAPRGMVHTIPFGSLGTVTNFSRDYIITKLNFRVRYDTNIDTVRKIIKKINNELSEDEEVAPILLGKIKSQGVRELDDSAMVMRVKFKTIPGKQFVVRRQVFQRMQQLFKENGIEFAHRNVTVYMPPETGQTASTEQKAGETETVGGSGGSAKPALSAGAAAALAAIQAEEDQKAEEAQKKK